MADKKAVEKRAEVLSGLPNKPPTKGTWGGEINVYFARGWLYDFKRPLRDLDKALRADKFKVPASVQAFLYGKQDGEKTHGGIPRVGRELTNGRLPQEHLDWGKSYYSKLLALRKAVESENTARIERELHSVCEFIETIIRAGMKAGAPVRVRSKPKAPAKTKGKVRKQVAVQA